jgi:hypothetical protein
MSNGEPRTVRELYIYVKGEFEGMHTKIESIKDEIKFKMKMVLLIGGMAGSIFSGIIFGVLKLLGA